MSVRLLPLVDARARYLHRAFTVARAGEGRFARADGLIATHRADQVPWAYDPMTGGCLGLMLEPAATNLMLQSDTLNTTWTTVRATLAAAPSIVAPDGSNNVWKLTGSTDDNSHYIQQTFTRATSTTYQFTVWVKAAELTTASMISSIFSNYTTPANCNINLTTGANVAGNGSARQHPNGWWECSAPSLTTGSATSSGVFLIQLHNGTTSSFVGDAAQGVYLWSGQLEQSAYRTSPIKTTTGTVTRGQVFVAMPVGSLPGYTATELTMVAKFRLNAVTAGIHTIWILDNNAAAERIQLRVSGGTLQVIVATGSVVQASVDLGTAVANTTYKVAFAGTAGSFAASLDGATPVVVSSGSMPAPTHLRLGNRTSVASDPMIGTLEYCAYAPRVVSQAQLQQLAA